MNNDTAIFFHELKTINGQAGNDKSCIVNHSLALDLRLCLQNTDQLPQTMFGHHNIIIMVERVLTIEHVQAINRHIRMHVGDM